MLVLSRIQNQIVRFPHLGIDVQILQISGGSVRVGISAPPEILVLRGELPQPEEDVPVQNPGNPTPVDGVDRPESAASVQNSMIQKSLSQFRHRIRNRLNVACLLLEVVQRKIDCGQWQQVEPLIDKALQAFRDIDEDLIVDRQPVDRADSLPSSTRILIVDDNVNEGHLLAELLTSFDFEVTVVGDGRKALHYLRQQGKPDLVLLDMNMPNLDGADTIRLIRQQSEFNGLRIFGVSGLTPKDAGVEIGPHGADAWYQKPINARQLAKDIATLARTADPRPA